MTASFVPYKAITIREAGLDESWLQRMICDSPNSLGLGDLRLVAKEKIISSGGKLDILLQDQNDEIMYEVEVQLGETDPSHIIRTIEYWDLIRKKYPLRQHYGVIIAESITKRFFNVISLLSATIPIIAIQCQILEIDGKRALVFTPILNAYEEPDDLQGETNTVVDEKYWESFSRNTLSMAKLLFEETKEIYRGTSLELNKWSIAIKSNGYNQMRLNKRSGDFVMIEMKYGNNREKIFELLERNKIFPEDKYSQARFTVSLESIKGKIELYKELAKLNVDWWRTQ